MAALVLTALSQRGLSGRLAINIFYSKGFSARGKTFPIALPDYGSGHRHVNRMMKEKIKVKKSIPED